MQESVINVISKRCGMNIIICLAVLFFFLPPARKDLIPSLYSQRPNASKFEQLFSILSNKIILQKLVKFVNVVRSEMLKLCVCVC